MAPCCGLPSAGLACSVSAVEWNVLCCWGQRCWCMIPTASGPHKSTQDTLPHCPCPSLPAGPRCDRDECMIRTTPSFRSGRHYGSFLLIQARCTPLACECMPARQQQVLLPADAVAHCSANSPSAPICCAGHGHELCGDSPHHPARSGGLLLHQLGGWVGRAWDGMTWCCWPAGWLAGRVQWRHLAWTTTSPQCHAFRSQHDPHPALVDRICTPFPVNYSVQPSSLSHTRLCHLLCLLPLQLAWRYSCLYFYERSYESGGRMFQTVFSLTVGGWSPAPCSCSCPSS
jgi:hypothetical protein